MNAIKNSSWRRRLLIAAGGCYLLLWLLTATWGLHDVDQAFDQEYAAGVALGGRPVAVVRIAQVNIRNPYNATSPPMSEEFWRYRSRGMAVAPFIVVDEAGAQWASMAGIGGRRVVFWFFGWTHAVWVQTYWVS